jgi:hypothetical protein
MIRAALAAIAVALRTGATMPSYSAASIEPSRTEAVCTALALTEQPPDAPHVSWGGAAHHRLRCAFPFLRCRNLDSANEIPRQCRDITLRTGIATDRMNHFAGGSSGRSGAIQAIADSRAKRTRTPGSCGAFADRETTKAARTSAFDRREQGT